MKTSKILQKAKDEYLAFYYSEINKSLYMCVAINHAAGVYNGKGFTKDTAKKAAKLTALINRRLEGYDGLEDWLINKHGIDVNSVCDNKLQVTRHNWIHSLIEEFKAKGD